MKNKTDQELQELAARAVGLDSSAVFQNGGDWDPLSDSEQAFDLMVELKMIVRCYDKDVVVDDWFHSVTVSIDDDSNRFSATRRAIVMLAAEIAEGM